MERCVAIIVCGGWVRKVTSFCIGDLEHVIMQCNVMMLHCSARMYICRWVPGASWFQVIILVLSSCLGASGNRVEEGPLAMVAMVYCVDDRVDCPSLQLVVISCNPIT